MTADPPPREPQKGLGTAVRELRRAADLSQEDLAQAAEIPAPHLALIESGEHDPTWGDMRRVAQALGVSLEALSELAEEHELDREV
ncbi:MAG TPA: helix-turn-helix transcriptional regulator [Solirubrobacterales bacterium]|nr:helix-turn-helix transcriptional regulator [Solirubrobacterales bacterium]